MRKKQKAFKIWRTIIKFKRFFKKKEAKISNEGDKIMKEIVEMFRNQQKMYEEVKKSQI